MTTNDPAAPSPRQNKALAVSLLAAQLIVGVSFVAAGAMKLSQPIASLAAQMPWTGALPEAVVRATGIIDLLGGLGIVLPYLTKIMPGLTRVAALGCLLLQIAAAIFHASRGEMPMLPVNFVFGALSAFVFWGRSPRAPVTTR